MPYVKSFIRLVREKRDYSDEVATSIPRPKSHWNFVVPFREKSENAQMFIKKKKRIRGQTSWRVAENRSYHLQQFSQ